MADEPKKKTDQAANPPDAPPAAEPDDKEDEQEDERAQLAGEVVRTFVRGVVSSKDIRQMLVELTKRRVNEILDVSSDANLDGRTLLLPGTSALQVLIVRRWLERAVVPDVIVAYNAFIKDGTMPTPRAEPIATTLSVAVETPDTPESPA